MSHALNSQCVTCVSDQFINTGEWQYLTNRKYIECACCIVDVVLPSSVPLLFYLCNGTTHPPLYPPFKRGESNILHFTAPHLSSPITTNNALLSSSSFSSLSSLSIHSVVQSESVQLPRRFVLQSCIAERHICESNALILKSH